MVNAINLPVSRRRMEKYQNMHTRQIACCEAVGGETIKGSEQLAAEGVDGTPNSTQLH